MSTCACTQPSKGFSLDWDAPFSFHDDTVFALLNCDISSSPIFKSDSHNNTVSPVCDTESGSRVCGLLNSCQAVSKLGIPVSTCCVYTPVDLGPSFEMDLQKLNCGSYSGLYGFKGHMDDPNSWKYGVALKYKFNFNNEYPPLCANCEKSNGVCGYGGQYNSFVCNCHTGINTTMDCFFESTWNGSPIPLPTSYGKLREGLDLCISMAMDMDDGVNAKIVMQLEYLNIDYQGCRSHPSCPPNVTRGLKLSKLLSVIDCHLSNDDLLETDEISYSARIRVREVWSREMMLLFEDASNGSRDDHMRKANSMTSLFWQATFANMLCVKIVSDDIWIADFGLSKLQHARRQGNTRKGFHP
ncbi:wall-associated receptor kinase-like protein 15 [Tanacetum coccineum]|uniref:Wall-associated receptor kinase-like protein 15 n=1 Tax=Tanacetum coccineum TaxID=301880 RepID=A0ABQ4ZEF7_9ASTR